MRAMQTESRPSLAGTLATAVSRTGAAAVVAALCLSNVVMVPPAAANDEGEELTAANNRWRGARCRTRQLIELKKGSGRDGWSKSKWLFWSPERGNSRARLWFSDGDAVRSRFGGAVLPIGTELVAGGWDVDDNDLYLELELADVPVRVRVFYWDDWVGRVSAKRIDDFERWARFDLFELLSSPEEELTGVAGAAPPAPVEATPPTGQAATPPATGAPAAVTLRVLAASVEPARVSSGQEVELVAVYDLGGVPEGFAVEVLETRSIFRDEQGLTTLEARAHRAAGAHESRQPLRLPSDLAAGVYQLEVTVEAGGALSTKTAIFEVR